MTHPELREALALGSVDDAAPRAGVRAVGDHGHLGAFEGKGWQTRGQRGGGASTIGQEP